MNLWTNGTGLRIWDNDQYFDTDGNLHTRESDKSTIPGLFLVTQVAEPTDPSLVILGFDVENINDVWTQVWQTRAKTADELAADIRSQAQALLDESDNVAIRCIKAQVPYPTVWLNRDVALRLCVKNGTGSIPDYPRNDDPEKSIAYPAGT